MSDYRTSLTVPQSPAEVVAAISDVRRWWTGTVEGQATQVGDEFSYRYAPYHFSLQRVTELVPDRRVIWHVLDAHLEFQNPGEWKGTEITFDVAPQGEQTVVRFTHVGLNPDFQCFEACSGGWDFFVGRSLARLIQTGEGPSAPPWG